MKLNRALVFVGLCSLACGSARGGDAVAIGYNADGVWTSVMYYSSSTPPGGSDYKDEAGAKEAALSDLKKRVGEGVVRTSILASSDRTAHVVYARGKTTAGVEQHAVGYGATQEAAKTNAFAELKRNGATKSLKVFYKYFSHGKEQTGSRPTAPRLENTR